MIVPCFTPRSITFCSPVQRNIDGYSPGVPRTEAHGRLLNLGAETRNIKTAREMISPADVFHKDDLSVCETLRELLNSTKSAFCQTSRSFCSKDYQFANLEFLWQKIRTLTSTTWQRKRAGSKQQVCAPRRPRWSVSWPEPPPAPSVVWPRGEGTLSKLAHDESCPPGKVMWSPAGAKSTNTRLPLFGLLVGLYWHHCTTNPHIVSHLSLRNIPPKFWLQIALYAVWVDWGAGFSTSTCALNAGPLHNRVSGGAGAPSRRCRDSDTLSRYNWGADSNKTGEQTPLIPMML